MTNHHPLLDEVRSSRPAVDWQKVDQKLFADERLVRSPQRPSRAGGRWGVLVGGVVAVAAGVLIFALQMRLHSNVAGYPPIADSQITFVDTDNAKWLDFPGQARVLALPHTKLRVAERGGRLRLQLLEGGVVASVVHVDHGEPFAIDVLGKRIAVHGTHLAVWIDAVDGIQVGVSQGLAAVGEPIGAQTTGVDVPAGTRAMFDENDEARVISDVATNDWIEQMLRGDSVTVPPPPPAVMPSADLIASPATHDSAPVQSAPSISAPAPEYELTAIDIRRGTHEITGILRSCLPPSPAGVSVSVSSSMELIVERDGSIGTLTFDPPLEPQIADCVASRLHRVHFPRSKSPTEVSRRILVSDK